MLLRKAITVQLQKLRFFASNTSTVDLSEMIHFDKCSEDWWNDVNGPVKALHSMNCVRVPWVRDGLINTGIINADQIGSPTPLKGISILDVGCGGGILTEPLARLGSNITGLDANSKIIELAKFHAKSENLDIEYVSSTIQDHASCNVEKYDVVVASEIIDHVSQKPEFIEACVKCLKPNGSIFVSTMTQTYLCGFSAIFMAEDVLRFVPKGTHELDKFIKPEHLQKMLEDYNCRTQLVHGMFYNFITNTWSWSTDTLVTYGIHAIKKS